MIVVHPVNQEADVQYKFILLILVRSFLILLTAWAFLEITKILEKKYSYNVEIPLTIGLLCILMCTYHFVSEPIRKYFDDRKEK